MKLSIRPNQTVCWLKLFVALFVVPLTPVATGESNCHKYCFESLCSQHNGTEAPEHANCPKVNMNCNCYMKMTDTDRRNVVGLSFLGLFGVILLMMQLCKQLKCKCECFRAARRTSGTTCNRSANSSTTGNDPDSSMDSQVSDSQSGSSTVISVPDAADLPPEYLHPPQYPHPPEYTSHVLDVDEMKL